MKEIHRSLWDEDFEAPDTSNVVLRLKSYGDRMGKAVSGNKTGKCVCTGSELTEEEIGLFEDSKCSGEKFKITVILNDDTELKSVKAFMIYHGLEELGEIINIEPGNYEELEDDEFGSRIALLICTEKGKEAIFDVLGSFTELKEISVKGLYELKQEKDHAEVFSEIRPDISIKSREVRFDKRVDEKTSVKVNINMINKLINLMGELVIDKESLNGLSKELKKKHGKDPSVLRLVDVSSHVSFLASEIEELVLSTRMLPLENIFGKFPRMVRDLAVSCRKKVNFIIEGKETGIDRGIIEELVDPLTHILRNSIDHGLETEEERVKKGKNPEGTLKLSASQGENHVVITVRDDGNGIDAERIREKALEKGLVSKEESDNLSDESVIGYIFEPGFSTAKEVSEISGRGVGLDVVKSNISRLNGIIDIDTTPGEGTVFTIKLPLTLAIIKVLLLREGPYVFALPTSSIEEIMGGWDTDFKKQVHDTGKNEVFDWRDHAIPLTRLGVYFQLKDPADKNKSYIIIVGHGEKKLALMTERIIGEQEIVIKSIGDFVGSDKLLGSFKGISGVSILGDGSFAQVVDIAAIMGG